LRLVRKAASDAAPLHVKAGYALKAGHPLEGSFYEGLFVKYFLALFLFTDFSVVLLRPNFMLVSEEHLMKMHKNQWLLPYYLYLISLGEPQIKACPMVPEVQTPSQWHGMEQPSAI
jgi:hypothetical protein